MRRRRHTAPWTNDLNGMGDELPVPRLNRKLVGRRTTLPPNTPTAPPRLRPVPRLLITAVCAAATASDGWGEADRHANHRTTTTSAHSATADHGRPANRHDFGLCCGCP